MRVLHYVALSEVAFPADFSRKKIFCRSSLSSKAIFRHAATDIRYFRHYILSQFLFVMQTTSVANFDGIWVSLKNIGTSMLGIVLGGFTSIVLKICHSTRRL